MAEKRKLLLCGDVNGKFNVLFSRVKNINKKSGPFDILLCGGIFFGDDNTELDDYKAGIKKVPVPTYIVGPFGNSDKSFYPEEGEEVCPNVVYIGKRGLFTSSGLKIAYLVGYDKASDATMQKGVLSELKDADCFTVRDACLRGQFEYRGVDVLITSSWPKDIQDTEKKVENVNESELISWLAMNVKPRYHIVPSDSSYYQRPPYRNPSLQQDYQEGTTRFIALAPVGNKDKEKSIYACLLKPVAKMRMYDILQGTTDETLCPYPLALLTQHQPGKATEFTGDDQYFFDMDPQHSGSKRKGKHNGDRERKRREFDPETCWFCLSSPTAEKHLVISVGTHCYLALAKGPLTPFHALILPITHLQASSQVPEEVDQEIKNFKAALIKMFSFMKKGVVFFERNYKTSHLQVQCVPVPKAAVRGLLELFLDEGGIRGIHFNIVLPFTDLCEIAPPGTPYFYAILPTGEQIFTTIRSDFPLQFGRDVLSSSTVLNCEDKADWRQCLISKEEEIQYVENFRDKFKTFDFTLEE